MEPATVETIDHVTQNNKDVWYFGFGANMHPKALEQRGIHPKDSKPAELHDFDLVFSARGMANVEECPGKSMHGVLHLLSAEHMKALAIIESGYNVLEFPLHTYDGGVTKANVFVIPPAQRKVDKPSERYMTLLIEGATHYKVKSEYIENVLRKVEFIPETSPENFLKFPEATDPAALNNIHPKDAVATMNEEAQKADTNTIIFYVNNKFVKVSQIGAELEKVIKTYFAGKDIAENLIKNMHNPKLPPLDEKGIQPIHRQWAEHFIMEFFSKNLHLKFDIIGYDIAPCSN